MFTTWLGYALLGFISVIMWLLIKGHANHLPLGETGHAGCPDRRVRKCVVVLGGSAGFTFGLQYFLLAGLASNHGHALFLTYGKLQAFLSVFNTVVYFVQLRKTALSVVPLKAHMQGCGFTTAWSPLWPAYWLGQVPGLKWLHWLRDGLTLLDYLSSFFPLMLISLFTKCLFGKWTMPTIAHVDVRFD